MDGDSTTRPNQPDPMCHEGDKIPEGTPGHPLSDDDMDNFPDHTVDPRDVGPPGDPIRDWFKSITLDDVQKSADKVGDWSSNAEATGIGISATGELEVGGLVIAASTIAGAGSTMTSAGVDLLNITMVQELPNWLY